MRKGFTIGRLVVTTVMQAAGAPVIDKCTTFVGPGDDTDRRAEGFAIRPPWHRRSSPHPCNAVVFGWMA